MSHTLSISVVAVGRIDTDDLGSHDIRDGQIGVDDDETARALVDRYRHVSWESEPPESDADTDESTEESEAEAPFDPGEFTVDELEARMGDNDYSDEEREALAAAERDGENRTGAIEALEP